MSNNNTNNKDFETLCSGYVLNALSNEDRTDFEEILQQADTPQKKLYYQLKSTANQMAFTTDSQSPAPGVKEALMRSIEEDKTVAVDTEPKSNRFIMAIAASFALLLISTALLFYTFNLNNTIGDKEQIITAQQVQITQLKNKVQQREELLSILSARTVDLVVMSGMAVNADGYGKIIWDPESNRALLQVSNLPPEPADKDYQLWVIKNNKPLPAGVFSVNQTDEASFFKIEELPDVSEQAAGAFAVTLEPEGGVPQPTGDMYLLGSAQ